MSNFDEFVIENSVLVQYVGAGGDVVIPEGITVINQEAFRMCDGINAVHLPDSVTKIGNWAFTGSGITEVNIPTGTEIGYQAFTGCRNLREIRLPDGLEYVDAGMFEGCSSLKNVIFSDTVTFIDSSAFRGCTSLETLVFPDKLEEIGRQSFDECVNLRHVELPQSVKTIDGGAFARCENLEFVGCNEQVLRIFLDSFNAKNLLELTYKYLTGKLVFSAQTDEKFSKYVKKNAVRFLEVMLHGDDATAVDTLVKTAGADAKTIKALADAAMNFEGAPTVKAYLLNCQNNSVASVPKQKKETDPLAVSVKTLTAAEWKKLYKIKNVETDFVELGLYSGTESDVAVPELIGKRKVLTLVETFKGHGQLESVTIPESVAELMKGTFSGCGSLREIVLPKKLKKIGINVFENCSSLTKVEMPKSVTALGAGAFNSCNSLRSVIFSPKIKKIAMNTFSGCTALEEITLPEKCKEIECFAFVGCTNLKAVHMGADMNSIAFEAFDQCPNLTIYAPSGSYAEEYAKRMNIPFVAE